MENSQLITDDFFIQEIIEKKHFLVIILKKDVEIVEAILKDNIDIFLRTFVINDHVVCQAKPRVKRTKTVLDIVWIKKYDLQITNQLDTKIDIELFIKKLDVFVENVKDKDYKLILNEFFQNENIREIYFQSPAAKNNHHNFESGLLQHSIEVTEISVFLANYYPQRVNLDLLVTGCLLHDVGKIKSYDFKNNEIVKTDWDDLLGHLSMSAIFISKMLPEGFDSHKSKLLYHLILSHHGKLEWGSSVLCKTKEAEILRFADEISSSLSHIDALEFINNISKPDELNKRVWYSC
jgi:3'-5' exoribonuclease